MLCFLVLASLVLYGKWSSGLCFIGRRLGQEGWKAIPKSFLYPRVVGLSACKSSKNFPLLEPMI